MVRPGLDWNRERLESEVEAMTPAERDLYHEWRATIAPLQPAVGANGWASLHAAERVLRHRARAAAFGPNPLDRWRFNGASATPRHVSEPRSPR